ncbi:MAG: response regulator transcription factor [Syntrophorhabdales bacterium]|jgi:two-component system phosphate regulon response regulator PhoB/two-component system alkaline phosphatase synthesis response regulator PhoP|nr:response regulator transcription factor [Syntrophorhabdales bacterium]
MAKLIAVIDDEPDIVRLVSVNLTKANFTVEGFENAESFLRFIRSKKPDLIILDLMLPDMDGFEVCKVLKNKTNYSSIPIIMLTARVDETEKVLGLELGADDYVTKPFSPRELVARVKAVLRRHNSTDSESHIYIGDTTSIDLEKHEVIVNGKSIDLTSTEFKILSLLASRKGVVFSRDAILEHLWGNEKTVIDRTVDVHIKHLREKLGSASGFIKNIRGLGYKLEE